MELRRNLVIRIVACLPLFLLAMVVVHFTTKKELADKPTDKTEKIKGKEEEKKSKKKSQKGKTD